MGDRTYVTIKIRRSDFTKHEKLFRSDEVGASHIEEEENSITLHGDEINYACWDELEKFLNENEMEYDKRWESGDDYESGNAYARIIKDKKGKLKWKYYEIYNTEETVLETLISLRDLYKTDPKKALSYMNKEIKKLYPFDAKSLDESNSVRFIKED
jgi:hypothetical protein